MSIYPSLEDMKFDQLARAQHQHEAQFIQPQPAITAPPLASPQNFSMYPSLNDYMGLELSEAVIAFNMPEYNQVAIPADVYPRNTSNNMVAPLSGQSLGVHRAQVTNGIREVC